ncbi:MAG: SDR family NAD(P)-dependent oxidoreductase [Planctomycetota bacterium]|jgi:3-oxoacyl-[acyl-carrier protein] reductase
MPDLALQDQVAVVTGGGWNIGRSVAVRFSQAGARVVVASRRVDNLQEVVKTIQASGGEALAVPTDVTRMADVENLVERAVAAFGTIDILAAAAGGGGAHAPIDQVTPEEWYDVHMKNLHGTFHSARCVLPLLRAKNRGVILTFTGGGAFFPMLGHYLTAYATAKAAICRFTDQLQAELLDTDIRVNCVEPGMVWSPDRLQEVEAEEARTGKPHPERQFNRSPEDAAELALFLASEEGAALRGRVLSVGDTWWRNPDKVRAVEETVHLYRLRRVDEEPLSEGP